MPLGRVLSSTVIGLAFAMPATSTSSAPAATQQIVVTAPSHGSTSGTLTAYQYSDGAWHVVVGPVRAALGYHGLSDNRSEGDGTTPTGTYGIGDTMYGLADAPPNPRYDYHHLVCGDWWSGVRDATYNTFQHIDCGQTMADSEALWQQTTAYQHFAVIDFNTNPTVIGRGSAIFLHDATTSGVTAGCVAVAPDALDAVLGWLDPAQSPVIRIGTRAQVGPPSPLVGAPPPPPAPPRVRVAPTPPRPRPTVTPVTSPPTTQPAPTTTTSTSTSTTTTTPLTPLALAAPAAMVVHSTAVDAKPLASAAAALLALNVAGLGALARRRRLAASPAG